MHARRGAALPGGIRLRWGACVWCWNPAKPMCAVRRTRRSPRLAKSCTPQATPSLLCWPASLTTLDTQSAGNTSPLLARLVRSPSKGTELAAVLSQQLQDMLVASVRPSHPIALSRPVVTARITYSRTVWVHIGLGGTGWAARFGRHGLGCMVWAAWFGRRGLVKGGDRD
jgi:hypothetical protein